MTAHTERVNSIREKAFHAAQDRYVEISVNGGPMHPGSRKGFRDGVVFGATTALTYDDAMLEQAARAMALTNDEDGCFEDVDAWENQEEWEREAYPGEYPNMSYEDCRYWIGKAEAALQAVGMRRAE